MSKHSDGPWEFAEGRKDRRDMSIIHKAGDKEFVIGYAICDSNTNQRPEDIANGKLFAAAPDLLNACEKARDAFRHIPVPNDDSPASEPLWAARDALIAAIAKATA